MLLALVVLASAAVAATTPVRAAAHPLSSTAILLDAAPERVTGKVQLPIDRLGLALDRPLTAATVAQPATLEELRRYVLGHISATGADGARWTITADGGRVQNIDDVDHLVFDLALRPPGGRVGDFRLTYDAIVHHLLSHKIFVSLRPGGSDGYTTVGVIDWQQHTLAVPTAGAGVEHGFAAAVRLGIRHIAEGADHLLFLVMLMLPAPLVARRRRWVPAGSLRRNCWRVAHVVTAFAVGHSITLGLATFGYVSIPTRAVESLIAASILVSGVHAIRPLVPGGEAWIAAGFGLMHGLAFAALLGGLGLGSGSLVADLLGFNLGIELTQLMAVALIMPSLLVLSRTRVYPAARNAVAGLGIVLAAAWLAERTTLISRNPLNRVSDALVAHPLVAAGTLAAAAAVSWSLTHATRRRSAAYAQGHRPRPGPSAAPR